MTVSAYGGSLREKAEALEGLMAERHLFAGEVLPHVVLPPVGRADHQTGNFEDACISTGEYLGAESFRWAATGQAEARERARQSADALIRMQTITGTPGFFARGFKQADGPTWDERAFFFWQEWHQAGEYRWLGDTSADSFNGRTFGLCLYYDLAVDGPERVRVREDMARVVGTFIDNRLRLVDVDGRMTLWGNFNPWILEENLNALQALNHLKCAWHVTGEMRFQEEYLRLIREHDYARRAVEAKVLPHGSTPPWDDNLGMQALYHLLCYEDDPDLLAYYHASLDRYWEALAGEGNPFFNLVYKVYEAGGRGQGPVADFRKGEEMNPAVVDWFRAYEPPRRQAAFDIPGRGRVQAVTEDSPHVFLRNYWMARYFGFLTEEA